MQKAKGADTVTILMGTYNGGHHLADQLTSIAEQSFTNWQVLASDDASSDTTPDILDDFAKRHPLTCIAGPRQGYVANFLHLLTALPEGPQKTTTAVAFCDQDDIWLPEKLRVALNALAQVPADKPALYCSRRLVWNPENDTRRPSLGYLRSPSFANACVENIAPGNTIVLNDAAAKIARALAPTAMDVFAHDWWLYLLITGIGGQILYDPEPQLLYRQHENNAIGAGEQFGQGLRNKAAVLRGAFADRVGRNMAAMQKISQHLTPENQRCLAVFEQARHAPFWRRLALLRQAGVYRQGRLSGLTFWGAACLGKI
jgi:glycosyltransferase involved in cell wall biosynthesis